MNRIQHIRQSISLLLLVLLSTQPLCVWLPHCSYKLMLERWPTARHCVGGWVSAQ